MSSSRFLYGSGVVAGGLSFEVDETCPNVTITINNITAIGNVGLNSGQMSIQWNTCVLFWWPIAILWMAMQTLR